MLEPLLKNERETQMPKCPNAQMAKPLTVGLILLSQVLVFAAIGCSEPLGTRPSVSSESASGFNQPEGDITIDGGLFFVDQPSYACIPFEKLSIAEDRKISSVSSSCECIVPSVVRYRTDAQQFKSAIRLDVKTEADRQQRNAKPQSLGVIITVRFADHDDRVFDFAFLLVEGVQ
jgi:hypothetical protein